MVEKLKSGAAMEEITKDMKYYAYYREAYGAVLDGMVGYFEQESGNNKVWLRKYGLKVFSPIAKNFPYSDFDDFGASRSYGIRVCGGSGLEPVRGVADRNTKLR